MDRADSRIQTTWGNSKECFGKAARLFPFVVEPIEIPYEGATTLPDHFYQHPKGYGGSGANNTSDKMILLRIFLINIRNISFILMFRNLIDNISCVIRRVPKLYKFLVLFNNIYNFRSEFQSINSIVLDIFLVSVNYARDLYNKHKISYNIN